MTQPWSSAQVKCASVGSTLLSITDADLITECKLNIGSNTQSRAWIQEKNQTSSYYVSSDGSIHTLSKTSPTYIEGVCCHSIPQSTEGADDMWDIYIMSDMMDDNTAGAVRSSAWLMVLIGSLICNATLIYGTYCFTQSTKRTKKTKQNYKQIDESDLDDDTETEEDLFSMIEMDDV
eukprot:375487_1